MSLYKCLLNRSLLQKSIDRLMYSRSCLSVCHLDLKVPAMPEHLLIQGI